MGRKIQSSVPQTKEMLIPKWPYLSQFKIKNRQLKEDQKRHFNKRHRAREMSDIPDDVEVWVTSEKQLIPGRVVSPAEQSRSYIIDTPTGELRRNRSDLTVIPSPRNEADQPIPVTAPRRIATRSQTGTEIKPPERLA